MEGHGERMDEFPDHLDLAVGQEWTVVLPGLGTAGYMWQDQVSGPIDVIEVSWSRGFAPGTEPAAVGVSAPETATIRALGPGDVTLHLVQVRPWERDATPISERRLTVRVTMPDAAT
jgi:predicted secreted protein